MVHLAIPILLTALAAAPLMANPFGGRAPVEPRELPAPDEKVEATKPALEKLDDGRMKLDDIVFDAETRELRFPAEINMREGLLEFLVVEHRGKIHESLLSTRVSPLKLNVVLKLLGFVASPELYYKVTEDGTLSDEFQEATPEQRQKSRLAIEVEWQDGERLRRHPLNEWILNETTGKAMPFDPWVYGGSFLSNGRFYAEYTGDIVAIYLADGALVNYSGKDKELDEVWLPNTKRVPPVGTPVTVIFKPHPNQP